MFVPPKAISGFHAIPIKIPGLPGGSDCKVSAFNVGHMVGSIPELGRSPGEGNDNPLQYSCQKIP